MREAKVLTSQGITTPGVARQVGVVEQTHYRWRKEYGGMRVNQAKCPKVLETENLRLETSITVGFFYLTTVWSNYCRIYNQIIRNISDRI